MPTGLRIPSFPNSANTKSPFLGAYGWIAGFSLDASRGIGRITVNVHPEEDAWPDDPVGQIGISFDEVLTPADPGDPHASPPTPPTEAVRFLSFAEFRAIEAEEGESAWDAQAAALLDASRRHPLLRDAELI